MDLLVQKPMSEMKRKVGRPIALTADKLEAARKLVNAGMPLAKVAERLGVSRSAVYRAFPQSSEARQPDLF